MALNVVLKKIIEKQFYQYREKEITIHDALPIQGGDTSETFKLVTSHGLFFLKCGHALPYPDMFEKEMKGLELLSEKNCIAVPTPLFTGSGGGFSFLVMEFIEKEPAGPNFWKTFAKKLAGLHRQSAPRFGLSYDNYIGPVPQSNKMHSDWLSFYRNERLEPLIRKCFDKKLLDQSVLSSFNNFFKYLEDLFSDEKPALIHGDLWGGNYLPGLGGQPYIFDPALYYGCREMDIAMTRLFGGFDRQFYWYYEEFFPLSEGWQLRIPTCQLYPLLVHALLFGGGYIRQVKTILSQH